MAETAIEWTWRRAPDGTVIQGFSFNAWIGCTRASEGCRRCYAETLARRFYGMGWGANAPRRPLSDAYWRSPGRWDRFAAARGVRAAVFTCSMADVFDPWVDRRTPDVVAAEMAAAREWARAWRGPKGETMSALAIEHKGQEHRFMDLDAERLRLWGEIERTPNLDWLVLTKRPEQYLAMTPIDWRRNGVPANVWIGTSTENQVQASLRLLFLRAAQEMLQSPVCWISAEPLLGPLDLTRLTYLDEATVARLLRASYPKDIAAQWAATWQSYWKRFVGRTDASWDATRELLGWVISGGQSNGPDAEALVDQTDKTLPLKPEALGWLRGIRDACVAADVAYFHKQHGGPSPKAGGKAFDGAEWCQVPSVGPLVQERVA